MRIIRDIPEVIRMVLVSIVMILVLLFFMGSSVQRDERVYLMNQAIRSSAISNMDHASRVEVGRLHLYKSDFEQDVKDQLQESNGGLFETANYQFEYLEDSDDRLKAVRLLIDLDGKDYQSTVVVDLAE